LRSRSTSGRAIREKQMTGLTEPEANHVHPVNPVYVPALNSNPRQSSMNRLLVIFMNL
jgi:hypothetical protein